MRRFGLTAALFFALTGFYLSFASQGLDDFDSFSFVLAMDDFDIRLQQPLSPGYPVYVFLANILRLVTGTEQSALILLSAVGGAASVLLIAGIGAVLSSRRGGIIAATVLAVTYGVWSHSGLALSDMTGIAFPLGAIYLLLRTRDDVRWFIAGCFVAGLALGVRLQNGLPVGFAGLLALAWMAQRHNWRGIILGGIAACVGLALWLIPTLQSTGGLTAYLDLMRANTDHLTDYDSFFREGDDLSARWDAYTRGWRWIIGSSETWFSLGVLVLLGGLIRVKWRSWQAWFVALWVSTGALSVFLFVSLERPRYSLTVLFPLVLLSALGWARWRPAFRVIPFALAFGLLLNGIPLASDLHEIASSPEKATAWIRADYPPAESIVIAHGSFRAAQVLLADYPLLFTHQYEPDNWRARIASDQPRYLIVMDRDDIPAGWIEAISDGYIPIADQTFERDSRIYPQHVTVRTQVLAPLDQLRAEDLAPPMGGPINLEDASSGRFFGEGWYRVEDVGGVSARWANEDAVLRVGLAAQDVQLTFSATPFTEAQTVTISLNGTEIDTVALSGLWQTYSVTLPAFLIQADAINTITLRHSRVDTPDGDSRPLSAAYAWLAFADGGASEEG